MTRQEVVKLAEELGWKPWGKLRPRPHNGSKYQCFRRGGRYAWIGNYFVEVNTKLMAQDYINDPPEDVRRFLT